MARRLIALVVALLICLLMGSAADPLWAREVKSIRFGVLPVLQALPLFVAKEKGLYEKAGVQVEVILFNTAAEKDIALVSGSIDGCFADLVTPTVLIGNGRNVKIVASNYDTTADRRMFAVLGKPGCTYRSLKDLAGVPVGISSNSVIDYVTERLLTSAGVPEGQLTWVETKNIPMRMQMLLSGQVEAATLPEPLVTAALAKGAALLGDDSGLKASQTVLVFAEPFLSEHAAPVKAFLVAVNEANTLINNQPDAVRELMVEHVRLPEPLKEKYPVPRFPQLHEPDRESVLSIAQWLKKRGIIQPALTYEQVVDGRYIP